MNILVGTFLVIKHHKTKISDKEIVFGCKKHGEHKEPFCSKCGNPKEQFEKSKISYIDIWDELDELDEIGTFCILADGDEDAYLLPNHKLEHSHTFTFESREDYELDFPDVALSQQEFKNKYAEAISKLKTKYGENKLEFRTKILRYYH